MLTCYTGKMTATSSCLPVNELSFDTINLIKGDIDASKCECKKLLETVASHFKWYFPGLSRRAQMKLNRNPLQKLISFAYLLSQLIMLKAETGT